MRAWLENKQIRVKMNQGSNVRTMEIKMLEERKQFIRITGEKKCAKDKRKEEVPLGPEQHSLKSRKAKKEKEKYAVERAK